MRIYQSRWQQKEGWDPGLPGKADETVSLVFVFGSSSRLKDRTLFDQLKKVYPQAHFLGCSTAGEIYCTQVTDDTIVATAIGFEHSRAAGTRLTLNKPAESFETGRHLGESLEHEGLVHVFMLSDGINVNGSELVRGLLSSLPDGVTVTGGLAGDGDRFRETLVFWDSLPELNTVAAVGFYGNRLKVGYGSLGGWDPFGPERLVTRSEGNVVYEFDGKSALGLYKKYLGEHADGLPATGLLFPLSVRTQNGEGGVVRTILAIDEDKQSMTFAGDVPKGSYARLMKANFDRLIDGAVGAAKTSYAAIGAFVPELAILISCVGRKMILQQRTEEEVEGVREALGTKTVLTGFYSYGEISPFTPGAKCELHNQTMTITVFAEQ